MMKNLRYVFVALMAMAGLNTYAQEVTLDFTLETSEGSKESVWGFPAGSSNKLVDEQSFTYDGYTIKVAGSEGQGYYWHDKNHYLLFGKEGAYLTLPAFNFDVERIDVEGNSGASAGVKQNIFVGDEAVSTETTGAQGTNFFSIPEGKQAAGTIYVLKVNSNHNNQVRTIKIWKKGSGTKQPADLSWNKASVTVTINGNDNVFPTLNNPNNLSVTYNSSKEDVATIDANGNVTLVAAGTAKISAVFEGNDSYEASTVSYNLTVKDAEQGGGEQPTVQTITVANAIEIANALEAGKTTTDEYIIKAYIVGAPTWTPYTDKTTGEVKNYNLTFFIGDSKNASETLYVYNAWNTENTYFPTQHESVVDGAYVALQGKLQKYVKDETTTLELVKSHFLSYDGSTGISNITVNKAFEGAIYNVAGQKVTNAYKGVVIMNGKKMLQK